MSRRDIAAVPSNVRTQHHGSESKIDAVRYDEGSEAVCDIRTSATAPLRDDLAIQFGIAAGAMPP
jgi:hypothetical protein